MAAIRHVRLFPVVHRLVYMYSRRSPEVAVRVAVNMVEGTSDFLETSLRRSGDIGNQAIALAG